MAIFTGAGVAIVTPFNDDEERSMITTAIMEQIVL